MGFSRTLRYTHKRNDSFLYTPKHDGATVTLKPPNPSTFRSMLIFWRSQLVLTCSTGYPPPPPLPRPPAQVPQDQATPLSLLVTRLRVFVSIQPLIIKRDKSVRARWPGADRASLPLPREGNHRRSGGPVHAARSAPLPCCPCPHSSPPNQCLPTDTTSEQALLSTSPLSIGCSRKKKRKKTGARRTERR